MFKLLADIAAIFRHSGAALVEIYLDFQWWALQKLHICTECGWRREQGEAVCDRCYAKLINQRIL